LNNINPEIVIGHFSSLLVPYIYYGKSVFIYDFDNKTIKRFVDSLAELKKVNRIRNMNDILRLKNKKTDISKIQKYNKDFYNDLKNLINDIVK